MKPYLTGILPLALFQLTMGALGASETAASSTRESEPTTATKIAGLEAGCAASAAARSERHAAKPLYERLGGYDRILALTTEIVRLHNANPDIKHLFASSDPKHLAKQVADFMAAGTGGTAQYQGRDMHTAHAQMKLTDADFLSAGDDIGKAMTSLGYGQNEIDEVVCILVSLKGQVVLL